MLEPVTIMRGPNEPTAINKSSDVVVMMNFQAAALATTVCTIALLILTAGCRVGEQHKSDKIFERAFAGHESELEALRSDIEGDVRLSMISSDQLSYGDRRILDIKESDQVKSIGMTVAAWNRYQRYLKMLNISRVARSDGQIEFRVDEASISNGSSMKGYWFQEHPTANQKASLDHYRISERDKDRFGDYLVLKRIKNNWYIYLFVNR